ncbi:hypothetical protein mRhiFer1_008289 [Rhinolophus ferrumequinum]|uniref:Uncharacterized protein n=1 Tax=Rhinolophus ferrumequinum TaxID=59479 RepID=A0A7J7VRD3_RHIFE|nr:hypothetical protein mRhiFer1_008289 [Rhinolophus ferrumequinum]
MARPKRNTHGAIGREVIPLWSQWRLGLHDVRPAVHFAANRPTLLHPPPLSFVATAVILVANGSMVTADGQPATADGYLLPEPAPFYVRPRAWKLLSGALSPQPLMERTWYQLLGNLAPSPGPASNPQLHLG